MMIEYPKTADEARTRGYGLMSMKIHYKPNQCAFEVYDEKYWNKFKQCPRNPGHGPSELYCAQHAKIVR